jgi:hypothetical protein
MSEFKDGYYWVKLPLSYNGESEHWGIAQFNSKFYTPDFGGWLLCGNDTPFRDDYFIEIIKYPIQFQNPISGELK